MTPDTPWLMAQLIVYASFKWSKRQSHIFSPMALLKSMSVSVSRFKILAKFLYMSFDFDQWADGNGFHNSVIVDVVLILLPPPFLLPVIVSCQFQQDACLGYLFISRQLMGIIDHRLVGMLRSILVSRNAELTKGPKNLLVKGGNSLQLDSLLTDFFNKGSKKK